MKPSLTQGAVESGVNAVNWTVSLPDFEGTVKTIAYAEALVESDPTHWLIVRRHSDLERAKREKRVAIMLGFQFPEPLGSDLTRFERIRRLGVRIMQLAYNNRSLFGGGCLEPGNGGLSKLGYAAIAQMNELAIAVDLSHSGKRTTAEAIETSSKPALITHAGCNVVHRHPRNKDDEELRSLADRGGVVGIYLMPYLVARPTSPTKNDVLKHLDHALNVCGNDHVGVGSDGPIGDLDLTPEAQKRVEEGTAERKRLGIAAPEKDSSVGARSEFSSQDRYSRRGNGKARSFERGHRKGSRRKLSSPLGDIWGVS